MQFLKNLENFTKVKKYANIPFMHYIIYWYTIGITKSTLPLHHDLGLNDTRGSKRVEIADTVPDSGKDSEDDGTSVAEPANERGSAAPLPAAPLAAAETKSNTKRKPTPITAVLDSKKALGT